MVRYRWFRIGWRGTSAELLQLLATSIFQTNKECGFVSSPQDKAALRFVWKSEILTGTIDETGQLQKLAVSSLSFVDFSIREIGKRIFLRIKNPPRTLVGFWNEVERIAGFGFWAEPVGLIEFAGSLLPLKFEKVGLVGLKLTNAVVAENVLARMEFVSKDGIPQEAVSDYFRRAHVVDYSAYELLHHQVRGQASFHRSGVIKMSENIEPLILELIELELLGKV